MASSARKNLCSLWWNTSHGSSELAGSPRCAAAVATSSASVASRRSSSARIRSAPSRSRNVT
eukprot:scaffold55932_cov30-Tisochrysis_lutea.AAC.3